jgi:hypothetical protein
MKCDCIENVERLMTEKMLSEKPGSELVDEVRFDNESWLIGGTALSIGQPYPMSGKYRRGERVRKFTTKLFPSYCPFCGRKIEQL